MDEPCSALDPVATLHIEELIAELKQEYTIVIVTHNMQQAARISDLHRLVLVGRTGRNGQYQKNVHPTRPAVDRRLHYGPDGIIHFSHCFL